MSTFPELELHIGSPLKRGENSAEELRRARLRVASEAVGPYDCARLLEMLGLVPDDQVLTLVVP
jgi:hypothetical protein